MDQNYPNQESNYSQQNQSKRNVDLDVNMRTETQLTDFQEQRQLFSKELEATNHDLGENIRQQQGIRVEEQIIEVGEQTKLIKDDYLQANFPHKISEKDRMPATDELQYDSGQDDQRRSGHVDSLEGIFANAIQQTLISTQPHEMQEHKLQRFDGGFPGSDEEYVEPEVFQQEEYISDETINVLCSPLLFSPVPQEHLCIPPPKTNTQDNENGMNGEEEGNENYKSQEENILFHNIQETRGRNQHEFHRHRYQESQKDQEEIEDQYRNQIGEDENIKKVKNGQPHESKIKVQKKSSLKIKIPKNQLQFNKNEGEKCEDNHLKQPPPQTIPFSNPSLKLESKIYCTSFFETKEDMASLTSTELILPQKTIKLKQIDRIKILSDPGMNNSRKIKLNYFTQYFNFSISNIARVGNFPLHFYWFAKIILEILNQRRGFDVSAIFVDTCSVHVKQAIIEGTIYKKSHHHLEKWEPQCVAITKKGLTSFHKQAEVQEFTIKRGLVTELSTKFEIYDNMLVIIVQHTQRTQFAIPILDYSQEKTTNWLWGFYQLIYSQ